MLDPARDFNGAGRCRVSAFCHAAPWVLCPRSSRPPKVCPRRDIIALRTPTIASAIMIGLALFGNWPLHQLDIDLAALQIAGYRSRLARRDHSAAAQASSVKTERLLALIAVVVVDCSISGVCFRGCQAGRAQAGPGRQCPSFRFVRHPTSSHSFSSS